MGPRSAELTLSGRGSLQTFPAKSLINVANRCQKTTAVRQPARTSDTVGRRVDFMHRSIADRDLPNVPNEYFSSTPKLRRQWFCRWGTTLYPK
jgi:hypothetical protein